MKIFYRNLGTLKVTVHNDIVNTNEVYTGIVSIDTYSDGGCKYVRLWTYDRQCHMIIDKDIEIFIEEA